MITNQEQTSGSRSSSATHSYTLTVSAATPTGVTVADFSASSQLDRVQLTWQAGRAGPYGLPSLPGPDPAGPGKRITIEPVWAQGLGSLQGFGYGYDDRLLLPVGATIYYWLEELHADGGALRHGPLLVRGAGSHRLYLPVVKSCAKSRARPMARRVSVGRFVVRL